jgi:hypothetical protein
MLPIQSESDRTWFEGLTWYVPLATTITSTELSARAVFRAAMDPT